MALETRGDLTLQSATIEKALFTIGASWRVNIVVGKDVQGNVSCIYRQAPLREVLDAILLANGYSYRAVGESLVVQRAQDVGSANPLFESAAISITHSDMQEILGGARLLLSKQGKIQALTSAKSFLVVDYADRVASIREFVARMDAAAARETGGIPAESYQRLQVSYFHTQYIPVESAREPLMAVLSQAGRVATMPKENRLVVVDYASNIAMVRRVLERIDRPVPQVRITALIYDISLQDVEQLGLNWNSSGKGNNLDGDGIAQQSLTLDTTTLIPFAATSAGGAATIRSLTRNFDITAVALLLQNANDARLLANPNVTVMDNETAEMSSVQQIPFQQLTQSSLGGQIGTTAFKDVGVTLQVTPTIAADGTIKLEVGQEFSRLAGFTETDQPIIDSRIANTTVRVANRKTLVIGGLRQRSDTGDFNGIPFLKDVKYIGPLFRSRNTTVRESELIVFLMPEIVSYDHSLSQRESLAQQTVNCRLARIPMAEGCGELGLESGCSSQLQGEIMYDGPTPSPLNDAPPELIPPAVENIRPHSKQQEPTPFRKNFGDRYRAVGGTNQSRRLLQESTSQAPLSVKDDSRALMRMLRPKR
ncbi:MAG: type II secretion system protein GspD [Planctomycetes bacterium]|nr:type II secretion system protein GspD [Planctomycetota bacterium]